jgi:hypothetical protein
MSRAKAEVLLQVNSRTAALTRFNRQLVQTRARLNQMAVVAAGAAAAGVAALAVVMQRSARGIDDLAKSADRARVSIQFYQALKMTTDQLGVSLETTTRAIQTLSVEGARAARWQGRAAESLRQLNLSARELNDLKPEDQFRVIADRLSQVSNANDRARLAQDLFGNSARNLLPLIEAGGRAIDKNAERIEKFGATITDEGAAKVEEMNDRLGDLRLAAQNVGNQLTIAFAPIVTDIANRMIDLVEETQGFATQLATVGDVSITVGRTLARVADVWRRIIAAMRVATTEGISTTASVASRYVQSQGRGLKALIEGNPIVRMINLHREATGQEPFVSFDPKEVTEKLDLIAQAASEAADEMSAAYEELLQSPTLETRFLDAVREAQEKAEKRAREISEGRKGRLGGTLGETNVEGEKELTILGGINAALDDIADRANKMGEAVRGAVLGIANTMERGISDSIQGLIRGTMTLRNALLSIADTFAMAMIKAFADMVAQYAVSKAAMFMIDKAQTAKSLALSVASAAKSLVAWIPAAIAASISSFGVAAAIGAAAVAGVLLTKGFAEGGHTGKGGVNQPAGVVHAGEWVAPQWMVNSPEYAGTIAALESARRGKSLSNYSMPSTGYATGGMVAAAGGGGESAVNIAIFDDRNAANEWLQSREGRRALVRTSASARGSIGVAT